MITETLLFTVSGKDYQQIEHVYKVEVWGTYGVVCPLLCTSNGVAGVVAECFSGMIGTLHDVKFESAYLDVSDLDTNFEVHDLTQRMYRAYLELKDVNR